MVRISPAVSATLARYAQLLQARFGDRLRELRLFGSWARGEATEDSDVDVMVAIGGLSEAERSEALGLAYDADVANEWPVALSPLVYSTEQAGRMRSGGRRLFRDIDAQGFELLGPAAAGQTHGRPHGEGVV
jgi:predicted nucleotidyltransferase